MSDHVIAVDFFNVIRVLPPLQEMPAPISVIEGEAFYEIRSELPGVDEDDVIVGVADDVLTIGAKACAQTQCTLSRFLTIDHRVALVEQSFALPTDADPRNLTTSFQDGVLSIFLARTPLPNIVNLFTR